MATGLSATATSAPAIAQARADPPPPTVQPLPPAVLDDKLEVEGEDVEARKVRSRLLLDVAVNGHGPYRFVVDSGADSSAVGANLARSLALPVVDRAVINSTTARETVDRVRIETLSVGSVVVHNMKLPALKESYLGSDGIIGIDALANQRLKMNFDNRIVTVEDARKKIRREPGEIVITARRSRGQLILTEVHASGLPLQAVIDTGSEITIGNRALREKIGRVPDAEITKARVIGVTGAMVELDLIVIRELQVGPIVMNNVPVAFDDIPPFKLFGLDKTPALLLGSDVLSLFRSISLDFRARRVRFQPGSCGGDVATISFSSTMARGGYAADPARCARRRSGG